MAEKNEEDIFHENVIFDFNETSKHAQISNLANYKFFDKRLFDTAMFYCKLARKLSELGGKYQKEVLQLRAETARQKEQIDILDRKLESDTSKLQSDLQQQTSRFEREFAALN